jgi:hypothetical protein
VSGVANPLRLVLVLAALAGCTTAPTAASQELIAGEPVVIDVRGDRRLIRSAPSPTVAQTDERPTYRVLLEGAETTALDAPVLTAALVDDGVLRVTPSFELVDDQGTVLDRDVVPELSVSADGRTVAYPHRTGEDAGVFVVSRDGADWTAPRCVTPSLASADRPLFLESGRLLVVGSVASGIAGVWIVDPLGAAQPVPVTNAALRTGRPLGPTFVPPPAYHASMRVESGTLVYDDGNQERRVVLPSGR